MQYFLTSHPSTGDNDNKLPSNKIISSRIIYRGKLLKLRLDDISEPDGSLSARGIIEHAPSVVVVPYLVEKDEVLFVEQYRDGIKSSLIELPAGKIVENEEIEVAARRELLEETGYEAGHLLYLGGFYTSPSYTNEQLHLYLATELNRLSDIQDTHEIHALHHISRMEAQTMIESGAIRDGKTILGLLWSAPHLPTQV